MKNQQIPPLISRAQQYGSIPGLDTIKALLREMGNPQEKLKIIHIAGTNGKGSIASFCQGMLLENDYNVGLFTSPYFADPREMIQDNRELISKKDFENALGIVEKAVGKMLQKGKPHPTEFEIYVAVAFYYFTRLPMDFLILEVGLGGREDATNVIDKPLLSIISQIGLDHTRYLGHTLKEIADHKGGIIKEGIPVIIYPQEKEAKEVLQNIAAKCKSPVYSFNPNQLVIHNSSLQEQCFSADFTPSLSASLKNQLPLDSFSNATYSKVRIRLSGKHQVLNAATALLGMKVLQSHHSIPLTTEKMLKGLFASKWPGRFEIIGHHPLTVVDGAHNVAAAKSLADTIKTHCSHYSITLLLGMLEDKDVDGFLFQIMPLVDRVVLTKPLNPRALDPIQLKEKLHEFGGEILLEPSISKASLKALEMTSPSGMLLGVGSLYMIGKAREILLEHFNSLRSSSEQR